jgi:hypothetical protein
MVGRGPPLDPEDANKATRHRARHGGARGRHQGRPAGVRVNPRVGIESLTELKDESSYITPGNLVTLAKENLVANFKFKIDACFAGRFGRVFDEAQNVAVLEMSSRFNEGSIAPGDLQANSVLPIVDPKTKVPTGRGYAYGQFSNPDGASSFTNANVHAPARAARCRSARTSA